MELSVLMLTFQHEFFIRESVESILNQKTNFDFELIICDDCSKDNTSLVINEIINIHPFGYRIKYIRQNVNIGVRENGLLSLTKAKGKYIAFCEGDDYWLTSNKLQKQYNILENNKKLSFVFHNTKIIYHDSTKKSFFTIPIHIQNQFELSTTGIINFNYNIATSSMFLRRECLFIEKLFDYNLTEKSMQLILSLNGKAKYIPDVLSVYRSHSGGVSYNDSKGQATKTLISMYNEFNKISNFKFKKNILKKKKQLIVDYQYYQFLKDKPKAFLVTKPVLLSRILLFKTYRLLRFFKLCLK